MIKNNKDIAISIERSQGNFSGNVLNVKVANAQGFSQFEYASVQKLNK